MDLTRGKSPFRGIQLWPRAVQFIGRLCYSQMHQASSVAPPSLDSGKRYWAFLFAIIANWLSAGVSVTGPCLARWSLCNLPFSLGGSFLPPSLQTFGRGPHPLVYFRSPPVPVVLPLIYFLSPTPRSPWAYKNRFSRGSTARAFQFPSSAVPALLSSDFSYSLVYRELVGANLDLLSRSQFGRE